MNKRIKQLAEQAGIQFPNNLVEGVNGPGVVSPKDKLAKFAELIVQECLKEIKDMIVDESELLYPNNKQTTEFVNDRLLDAYDNIKEHFGVSE
jgi:hypothetical protein